MRVSRPELRKPLGFKFQNHPASSRAMESGQFEPSETAWFERQLRHHSVFINIGANTGYYTLMALKNNVRTIAFEPDPNNVKFLLRNIEANKFQNVEVFPVALSGTDSVLTLHGGSTGASLVRGWARQRGARLVPAFKMDTLLADRIMNENLLILCDVEGAELSVLRGGIETLSNARKVTILIELPSVSQHHPTGTNPDFLDSISIFEHHGFQPFVLTDFGETRELNFEDLKSGRIKPGVDANQNLIFIK